MSDILQTAKDDIIVADITDKDKENYWRHITVDEYEYTDEITLLNGKLKLLFKAPTVEVYEDIKKQIEFDQQQGIDTTDSTYLHRIDLYRMVSDLVSIDGKDFLPLFTKIKVKENKEKGITYVATRANALKGNSLLRVTKYVQAHRMFDAKMARLSKESQNPDFYKAAV